MTQLEYASSKIITPLMKRIAKLEAITTEQLSNSISRGRVVILNNKLRRLKFPCAVGEGLKTKVNANIGTSTDRRKIKHELKKLDAAVKCGADTVMDLSIGPDTEAARLALLKNSQLPFGTVPIYEAAIKAQRRYGSFLKMGVEDIFSVLETQAKQGVDFFTIHAGLTRKSLAVLKKHRRLMGIVSRGGAIINAWISYQKKENPLYEYFDRILDIAYKYDVTLSLGDALRPGSVIDATDQAQISELKILGELARRSRKRKVQVIIEGPGHVPLNQIKKNVHLQKEICDQAPFYVLGPLVTDVAPGYDHITAAIGGAIAASEGADFLCYVTPSEHLRHPSVNDVKDGVIAARIAAHSADLVKNNGSSIDWDRRISFARQKRNWRKQIRLSIDPDKAKKYRESSKPLLSDVCTMCGKYCSIKLTERCL